MRRLQKLSQQLTIQPNTQKQFLYGVPVGYKIDGQTQAYRHPDSVDGLMQSPEGINSLADFWDSIVAKFPDHPIIQKLTYSQVDSLVKRVGSWLLKSKHEKVYIYCKNSPEWTITDLAGWNYGMVTVPLYDTLGHQAFDHILRLTEGTALTTDAEMLDTLIKNLKRQKGKINTIILFDRPNKISAQSQGKIQTLLKMGLQVFNFHESLVGNNEILTRPQLSLQSHLTYSFTSGTTGLPKGVINTHQNVITQVISLKEHYEYNTSDVHMSYLPIAHIFERFVIWCCIYFGANIQYHKHPPSEIVKDLAVIKPTTIPIVPRLLNKLYPIAKQIYEKEPDSRLAKYKIKLLFGGKLRMFVTASAPVASQILCFFRQMLEIDVRQGYGQTETTALTFVTYKGDGNYGHVGGVNKSTEYKLVDVPEMNCFSTSNPPKGQVCTRGPSTFVGYYKNKEKTEQTLDSGQWNHSGDIGIILPNGSLKIVDRKKNIYKLSQGQYVAPEKVQNIYKRCKYVAQCYLYGDSMKDYNVAIIHPNLDFIYDVAKAEGINETDVAKLCENPKIIRFIHTAMNMQAQQDGLFGFETAKKIKLYPHSFAMFDIFTSTMKLQRAVAKKVFIGQIDKLYASL